MRSEICINFVIFPTTFLPRTVWRFKWNSSNEMERISTIRGEHSTIGDSMLPCHWWCPWPTVAFHHQMDCTFVYPQWLYWKSHFCYLSGWVKNLFLFSGNLVFGIIKNPGMLCRLAFPNISPKAFRFNNILFCFH